MEFESPPASDPVSGTRGSTLFGFHVPAFLPSMSAPVSAQSHQPLSMLLVPFRRLGTRNLFLGACALLLVSAIVFLYSEESLLSPLKSSASRPALHSAFDQLFPIAHPEQDNVWQDRNAIAMRSLLSCITAGSCGPNQTSIVLLADVHFVLSIEGYVSGEDIWALSVASAVVELGYTVFYSLTLSEVVQQYRMFPDLVKVVITEAAEVENCVETSSCIKSESNPLGIPIWKLFSFHFWTGPAHLLGRPWTLSPENFHNGNQYLGYSVEESCTEKRFIPHYAREDQVWVMGKHVSYFHHQDYAWSDEILSLLHDELPVHLAAGLDDDGGQWTYPPFIQNFGHLDKEEFYNHLSRSRALLGIGLPPLSPSPYDALCFGVPFINPVHGWDENDPTDRTKWGTQHEGLQYLDPPYVYQVRRNDSVGLLAALKAAVAHPIDRFIPPAMRQESLRNRVGNLVESDWRALAVEVLRNRTLGIDDGPQFDL